MEADPPPRGSRVRLVQAEIAEGCRLDQVKKGLRPAAWSVASRLIRQHTELSDKEALEIAETTDVSPKQAKDLAAEHGKEKAKTEAAKFKAES